MMNWPPIVLLLIVGVFATTASACKKRNNDGLLVCKYGVCAAYANGHLYGVKNDGDLEVEARHH
jgi:hypothetical protein